MSTPLPDSVSELQAIVADCYEKMEGFDQEKALFQQKVEGFESEISFLREELRLLRQKLFGSKSEKYDLEAVNCAGLFPELQENNKPEVPEKQEQCIDVAGHSRKKPGRKPIPDDLPRIVVEHDLTDNEKVCGCGCTMSRIGEESSEQLDMTPASYQVIRHVRYKYACKSCQGLESEDGTVKIAPVPDQIIPKSIATPRLLAHILAISAQPLEKVKLA